MMSDSIARFRRFARAVTAEVGALDTSFLGRGRPLGAARVVNAIGAGRTDVAEIRAYLDLDSGLMSRLLRSLEDEGLLTTEPHPDDARRRVARLTEAGQREYAAYEDLSDARASALLARAPRAEELLRAMDLVALTLGRDRFAIEEVDPRSEAARTCLQAYYAELARRLKTGFDVKLSRDPEAQAMIRPRGAFLLATADGLPVGCVGLKGRGGPVAEIKRLWIDPAARGFGLARQLMEAVEAAARDLSIAVLRLDTNSALPEALALYRKAGWVEIDRFNDDPYPDHFFEKVL
ncbi:helix-turn-helix domain-containing GNAT family N-acetyltransferase [Methylobacterium sp. J-077]|uniref:bifunctional helix-turn-helix transcriptional regulator/GNAT family N-acetyltransferase n=1 Tax=Methylobacterium sp. J-077 TaxID=2836656 RepID=UPI001FB8F6FE|nr:helix-turn-helix domain-containing GNAT family N-acetyltransferase [Methylobacterium sp. J-077]MCJ2127205.1 bifunctional helix-turn-helix transcriptional regulator/GNAT family N-acetyltransferase [Methylobacterium sp. J-077]